MKDSNKETSHALKLFEAFAGYGGASFALSRAGIPFETVGFSENDKFAIELYEKNHSGVPGFGDITKINPKDLPDFDLFTGGFPCQPFSNAGLKKGFDDTRGTLFFNIKEIVKAKIDGNKLNKKVSILENLVEIKN